MTEKIDCKNCTVKREGHIEKFDERKVHSTVYAACLSAGEEKKECKKVADEITTSVKKWIKNRKVTASDEIFKKVTELLTKKSKEAGYMYKTHRDIN